MKKKQQLSTATLFKRYILFGVLLPHLIYAFMIHCPSDGLKLGLAITFFLPLSIYFLPPATLAGGHGFVCQIGCGPISPLGYIISLAFWTGLALVFCIIRKQWKQRKANQ
jgi:hypothetical protein